VTTQYSNSMVQQEVRPGLPAESALTSIAEVIHGWLPGKVKVRGWLRTLAFRAALGRTYTRFARQEEQWVDSYFDEYFVRHYAAPLLNRYLQDTPPPTAVELAALWANQFRPDGPAQKHIADLAPVAADFLASLEAELQRYPAFRDVGNS
jgi:hypothetical protein